MLRMKSLLSPSFSTLSPHLTKTTSFSLYFLASKSILCNSQILKNPDCLHIKSTISSMKPLMSSNSIQSRRVQIEASQSSSGEIHVIVGPMFAGKTTTLLRRIQSETSNGRFGAFFDVICPFRCMNIWFRFFAYNMILFRLDVVFVKFVLFVTLWVWILI